MGHICHQLLQPMAIILSISLFDIQYIHTGCWKTALLTIATHYSKLGQKELLSEVINGLAEGKQKHSHTPSSRCLTRLECSPNWSSCIIPCSWMALGKKAPCPSSCKVLQNVPQMHVFLQKLNNFTKTVQLALNQTWRQELNERFKIKER